MRFCWQIREKYPRGYRSYDELSKLGARDEARKGEFQMKQSAMLTIASLLTILFMTLHLAGDILFQMSPAGLANLFAVFVLAVQLYGTLVLGGRRAGYIIILLGSALGLVIPIIHMKTTHGLLSGDIGNSSQAFLFVWTMLALGVTSTFCVALSASALLRLPWRRSRRVSSAA
jgi:hypothetical protein